MRVPASVASIEEIRNFERVFIYGAGGTGKSLYGLLSGMGVFVPAFVETKPSRVGFEISCLSPEDYVREKRDGDILLVASVAFMEIAATLDALGVTNYSIALPFILRYLCGQTSIQRRYMEEHFPRAGVFFDIGANIGVFSRLLVSGNTQVHAFEPNPKNIDAFGVVNRGLDGITLHSIALDEKPGRGTLHVPRPTSTGAYYPFDVLASLEDRYPDCEPVPVDVSSLDVWCRDNRVVPTAVKIDCEWKDYDIIRGAWGIIREHRPHLMFESYDLNNDVISDLSKYYSLFAIPQKSQRETWGFKTFLKLDDYLERTGGRPPLNIGAVPA